MGNETEVRYVIEVCDGNTCHIRKSKNIARALWKELGLSSEKTTTDDNMFSVTLGPCMGKCGPGPWMKINSEEHEYVTPEKAVALVQELKESAS